MKTLIMTVGELDYTKLLATVRKGAKLGRIPYSDEILLYVIFVIFVLVMPIIVMNLLLGLAVGDIENIRKLARTKELKNKAVGSLNLFYNLPIWLQKKLHAKFYNAELPGGSKIKVSLIRVRRRV